MFKTINCNGFLLEFNETKIMGILNYTPDSFSDGGQFNSVNKAIAHIEHMFVNGADIVDIGAISTKPGSKLWSAKEEISRLKPLLTELKRQFPNQLFSLDTFRADVARWAVESYPIAIINDISAGEMDANMFETIAQLKVPYIIMHMQGQPQNMQDHPQYQNITQELILYFANKVDQLKQLGVKDIIIDPGFGFGKTLEHNYQLMKELNHFNIFDQLLMVGISRKSMIQKQLGITVDQALNGTSILNTLAITKGAHILRVHDVKEARQAVVICNAIR